MAIRRLTDLDMPPDVFAVVMATGIVSIAARDHGYSRIDLPLAALAALTFVLLLAGLALRLLARPMSAFREVRDPDTALRLFTFVAACAVLGARLDAHRAAAWPLAVASAAAWLILAPLAVRDIASRPRAELRQHAHGAWLLASVATAGVAITAADLATGTGRPSWFVVSATTWIVALVLYVVITWLIVWRAVAAPLVPEEVPPDSWILMGALAIVALAGDRLLAAVHTVASPSWLVAVIGPSTLALWVLASLWIPVLLYAELWRVDHRAGSLRFAGAWWSAVFPLGMYATATQATSVQLHLRSLATISLVLFWIAFTVWLLVAVGGLHALVRNVHGAPHPS